MNNKINIYTGSTISVLSERFCKTGKEVRALDDAGEACIVATLQGVATEFEVVMDYCNPAVLPAISYVLESNTLVAIVSGGSVIQNERVALRYATDLMLTQICAESNKPFDTHKLDRETEISIV